MAIQQGLTTSFKQQMIQAGQNLATDTLYIALYTAFSSIGANTTVYTTSNEITGTGYTAGGEPLVISNIPTGDTTNNIAFVSFDPVTWTSAAFTCRGALIYNSTTSATVAVLNFGSDKTTTGTFTITFPTPSSTTAVITIS